MRGYTASPFSWFYVTLSAVIVHYCRGCIAQSASVKRPLMLYFAFAQNNNIFVNLVTETSSQEGPLVLGLANV